MKKIGIILTVIAAMAVPANAQKVGFINTDSVMMALPDYQNAIKQLDAQASQYKQELDNSLKIVEQMYNSYQSQKNYLSTSQRTNIENEIIAQEQQVKNRQESYFGKDGTMAKASEQLLKPIRDKVSAAVAQYAASKGYTVVMDLAITAGIIYKNDADDMTQAVINILK